MILCVTILLFGDYNTFIVVIPGRIIYNVKQGLGRPVSEDILCICVENKGGLETFLHKEPAGIDEMELS